MLFSHVERGVLCLAVIVGSLLRSLTGIVGRRSLQPIAVYSKIVRLAGAHFVSGRG